MDTLNFTTILDESNNFSVRSIGSKAKNLSLVKNKGYKVPDAFFITTSAYNDFLTKNRLDSYIDWEITRKPFDQLRWEEIWDSALRIRLSFLKAEFPKHLEEELKTQISKFDSDTLFSVRSSSPDEDSREYSFAGIHESFINVCGIEDILEKIKLVWASLWSDRSLLYKKEHNLDSLESSMAVIVQVMAKTSTSGLLFTQNPSKTDSSDMVIEAISGSLDLLVDNKKSPDRIILNKSNGKVVDYKSSFKDNLLNENDLNILYKKGLELEKIFETPIDIEWTGLGDDFTVLQVRPITHLKIDSNKDRKWYLTLTPHGQTLIDLTDKVENTLIPELQIEGEKLSKVLPSSLDEDEFLDELKHRGVRYKYWLDVYWSDFIPLAHGIRNFGVFYNDLIAPNDPYEFVNLLKTQSLLAYERNNKMKQLAHDLIDLPNLRDNLTKRLDSGCSGQELLDFLNTLPIKEGTEFRESFLNLLAYDMDVLYDNTNLENSPEVILGVIIRLSNKFEDEKTKLDDTDIFDYKNRYIASAREQKLCDEALTWLKVGRVSWKLRDDDNILLGKIENQLLIYIRYGIELLKSKGKNIDVPDRIILTDWQHVYDALKNDSDLLIKRDANDDEQLSKKSIQSRQLMGQPSSSGVYTGNARVITTLDDFKEVENGEVLVFDAVQPQMTFIISLAGAIIERRGGMLVHSSIIAREMDIPAVNGVNDATTLIKTGDSVTVNGDLGVVVIGSKDFDF